jgi:hypothetical protein
MYKYKALPVYGNFHLTIQIWFYIFLFIMENNDSPQSTSKPPKLLDQFRAELRLRHFSYRTEQLRPLDSQVYSPPRQKSSGGNGRGRSGNFSDASGYESQGFGEYAEPSPQRPCLVIPHMCLHQRKLKFSGFPNWDMGW